MKFHPLNICMVDYMSGEEVDKSMLKESFDKDFIGIDFSIKYSSSDLDREIYLGDMFIDKRTKKIYTFTLFRNIRPFSIENKYKGQGISSFGFVNIENDKYTEMKVKNELTLKKMRSRKIFFKNLSYIGNIFRHKTINKNYLSLTSNQYQLIHSEIMKSKQFSIMSHGLVINFNEVKNYKIHIVESILNGIFNILMDYKKTTLSGILDFVVFTGEIFELNISLDKFKDLYLENIKENTMNIAKTIKNKLSINNKYLDDSIMLYHNFLIYLNDDGEIVEYNGYLKSTDSKEFFMLIFHNQNLIYKTYVQSLTNDYEKKLLLLI